MMNKGINSFIFHKIYTHSNKLGQLLKFYKENAATIERFRLSI